MSAGIGLFECEEVIGALRGLNGVCPCKLQARDGNRDEDSYTLAGGEGRLIFSSLLWELGLDFTFHCRSLDVGNTSGWVEVTWNYGCTHSTRLHDATCKLLRDRLGIRLGLCLPDLGPKNISAPKVGSKLGPA